MAIRTIAFVDDCRSHITAVQQVTFEDLAGRFDSAAIGAKDGPGWIPAHIELGPRKTERVKAVSFLALDVEADAENVKGDDGEPLRDKHGDIVKQVIGPEPPSVDALLAELSLHEWQCFLHTSYSHGGSILPEGIDHPRYRVTFDLSRPLRPEELKPLGLYVAALLGIDDCFDRKCLEPARLFYVPRCPAERLSLFQHDVIDGDPLPVDKLLAEARKIEDAQSSGRAQRHGGQTGSVIKAFNDAHDVGAILERYGYQRKGRRRWLWPGSTTGRAGVRQLPDSNPERVYSSHSGDPLSDGHAHDAFDAWRILEHGGDMTAAVREAARLLGLDKRNHDGFSVTAGSSRQTGENKPNGDSHEWPEPQPLPEGLSPVAAFDYALLPDTLKPWAQDICERVQCAPDYVGMGIMTGAGSVLGRKVGIRPQAHTDWTVTTNQWGLAIGRPGVLKSPAMEAALSPLKRLAAEATEAHQAELADYKARATLFKLQQEAAAADVKKKLAKGGTTEIELLHTLQLDEPDLPELRRYIANDTTAAALGELHRQNPNGLLVFRDELVSLLKSLDREDNAEARGFYLTGWNGDSPYTFDRITRGFHLHIPAVCLSLLGSTQPGRIADYIRQAVRGGSGDDGLIQRFGLLVWPDNGGDWRDVDRWPDSKAKQEANRVFDSLDRLDPLSIGAQQDSGYNGEPDGLPYLRFDTAGLGLFLEWRTDLEARLRSGELHPAMESHLAKYRKLVPGLALILHLASGGTGPVSARATLQALAWAEYLETHARRAYASVTTPEISAAKAIIQRLRKGDLPRAFSSRDVWRPGWAMLSDRDQAADALRLLVDLDWLTLTRQETAGRTATVYEANPRGLAA